MLILRKPQTFIPNHEIKISLESIEILVLAICEPARKLFLYVLSLQKDLPSVSLLSMSRGCVLWRGEARYLET
jgi:hypothetical protein